MCRLEKWYTRVSSPYAAPEQQAIYLHGEVFDHPSFQDGKTIGTSRIIDVNGNKITTKSGTMYLLGEPDPEFVEYCEENGVHVPTKEVPIKEIKNDN